MANLKNLNNIDEPRAHRFLSAFAHHVGEEKFEDNGSRSQFHKRHYGFNYGASYGPAEESDLMRAARIEKEKKAKEKERLKKEAQKEKARHWWEK